MPIQIPSWAFGVLPTSQNLSDCRTPGLIQDAVKCYPDAKAYWSGVNFGPLPPVVGSPKYWSDSSVNTATGYARLNGETHAANAMSLFENSLYSQNARNFYAERPNLLVPQLVAETRISHEEWGRLSFADAGIEDPAEFPLALIYEFDYLSLPNGIYAKRHTFPSDVVLFLLNGQPCAAKLDEAKTLFPVAPQMPVGPGAAFSASADQVIALATKMNSGTSVRVAAKAILDSAENAEAKAGKLVKL